MFEKEDMFPAGFFDREDEGMMRSFGARPVPIALSMKPVKRR